MSTMSQPDLSALNPFASLLGGRATDMANGMQSILKTFAGFGCLNGAGQSVAGPDRNACRDDKDDSDDGSALIDPKEFSQLVFLLLLGLLLLEFARSLGLIRTIKAKVINRNPPFTQIIDTNGNSFAFNDRDNSFFGPKGEIVGIIEVIGPDGTRTYFFGK